jgi:hypothetical protein
MVDPSKSRRSIPTDVSLYILFDIDKHSGFPRIARKGWRKKASPKKPDTKYASAMCTWTAYPNYSKQWLKKLFKAGGSR